MFYYYAWLLIQIDASKAKQNTTSKVSDAKTSVKNFAIKCRLGEKNYLILEQILTLLKYAYCRCKNLTLSCIEYLSE
jgi:hypothetical protein